MEIPVSRKFVLKVLDAIDKDCDGTIQKDEFIQFYFLIPIEELGHSFKSWAHSSLYELSEVIDQD
jgi:hypothetical protein